MLEAAREQARVRVCPPSVPLERERGPGTGGAKRRRRREAKLFDRDCCVSTSIPSLLRRLSEALRLTLRLPKVRQGAPSAASERSRRGGAGSVAVEGRRERDAFQSRSRSISPFLPLHFEKSPVSFLSQQTPSFFLHSNRRPLPPLLRRSKASYRTRKEEKEMGGEVSRQRDERREDRRARLHRAPAQEREREAFAGQSSNLRRRRLFFRRRRGPPFSFSRPSSSSPLPPPLPLAHSHSAAIPKRSFNQKRK